MADEQLQLPPGFSQENLKAYLDEILGTENQERKKEHLKRTEIYRKQQKKYILEELAKEFDEKTVKAMRTITSINLTERIIDEQASIYKSPPKRSLTEASETEQKRLDEIYESLDADVAMKKLNRYFKLHQQATNWIIPRAGKLELRILAPHQYDVIPDPENPEVALAYIVSVFDRSLYLADCKADGVNQKIGDRDDYKAGVNKFVWWTKTHNFTTNRDGKILGIIPNPIKRLPFVDVSEEKDYEYWTKNGSPEVEFAIDFGVLISDTANINRLQGYSQAIVYAEDMPEEIIVGPNRVLRIPLKADATVQPKFEFATPSPDMASSLELIETYLRLFLSSRGVDPKSISGKSTGERFSSGIERLLSMIEKFEASKDDFDKFKRAERETFEIARAWTNELQGTGLLTEPAYQGKVSEGIKFQATFSSPEVVQTISEREDSAIKQVDARLMSRTEAVAYIRQVDEKKAEEIVKKIDEEEGAMNGGPNQPNAQQASGQAQGQPPGATGGDGAGRPGAAASGGAGDSREDNQANGGGA